MSSFSSSSASSVANFLPPNNRHLWNLLFSVPVLIVLRLLAKSMPYAKQGFFCNDNEIRYPYVSDTVPPRLMDMVFIVVGLFSIISSECSLIRHLTRRNSGKRLDRGDGFVHPLAVNCLYFLAALYCSIWSTSTICNLGKRTCSRLRPNFLAVCQPRNLSTLCPLNNFDYISDYECQNTLFDQNEFFSFPSGHAALVCNFAVFTIYYLQKRCKLPPVLRSFYQFLIALFAYFVCLSRVRDHKHRLADVAGGALTGMALGAFFIRFVLHNFRPNRYALVDREWPMDYEQIVMPIGNNKFSVPQTIVALGNGNGKSCGAGNGNISGGGNRQLASDYGSFISPTISSASSMFGADDGTSSSRIVSPIATRANSVALPWMVTNHAEPKKNNENLTMER